MSTAAFRALRKKMARNSKQQDKSTSALGGEPAKRKSHSVSTPPEHLPISPSHGSGYNRKPSATDSPSHRPNILKGVVASRKDSHPTILTPQTTSLPLVTVIDDSAIRERQDIIDITVDVQNFLAAISRLKQAMEETDNQPDNEDSTMVGQENPDIVLNHLSELVLVVQTCLEHNSNMQSTEIKNSATTLIQSYQECSHVLASSCSQCNGAIESLIDAFTGSVSEYLTGESVQLPTPQRKVLEKSPLSTAYLKGFSKSHDNLAGRYNSYLDLTQPINNEAIVDQIDHALAEVKESVVTASKYLKARLKYHREITSYMNKRAQIESRYHQQMAKLGKSTQQALDELLIQEPCLPLVDTFKTSVEQDMKFASNCNTTYNIQVGGRLIEPLEAKCSEYEKKRKEFTQTWQKEQKKLSEARTSMKSAKSRYMFLGQDLVRVKNLLAVDPYGKQADKRKKEVADTEQRWHDSEVAYKNALALCNDCQYQVHVAAKKSILCAYRRIMIDADTQLQSSLETYFTLQHNFFQTLTEPMVQNIGTIQEYDVGSEFMRYIDRQEHVGEELEDYLFEEFDPEATDMDQSNGLSNSDSAVFLPNESGSSYNERPTSPNVLAPVEQSGLDNRHTHPSPRPKRERPWSEYLDADSRSDPRRLSDLSYTPSKEGTTSPSLSMTEQTPMSRNAMAHSFKKLRGPARCRECDTYVYFHGSECETCGLACHRNCLATLAIKCGNKRLGRKMNTFGVDFSKHLKATKRLIPIIVTECIAELDLRGLDTRGLYRVSSGKSKLEHLCQLFETGGDRVDLSDRPAHLIGSCLKLYFRQLPEPLLTFELYQKFLDFARESSYILPCNDLGSLKGERADAALGLLERLKGLIQSLPSENYVTLAKLLYHLKRVSCPQHVKNNFMPPSNLGIVFAPNLLRQREMVPSLKLLADMTAQAKAVEIMISHVDEIIHVPDEDIMDQYTEDAPKEVLVDGPIHSSVLDVDDALTMESRTPNTTPPERRRENVSELSDVLSALEMVGRRNSQPSLSFLKPPHPQLGEVRNSSASTSAPVFSSLPPQVGGEKDTLAALGRLLRAPTHTPPIEKMLTPVKEGMFETDTDYSDEEPDIMITGSQKIDGQILSRSESGLSNPVSWALFDADSEVSSLRDSISMLSTEGDDSLPRGYRMSAVSLNGTSNERRASKEDILPKPVLLSVKSSSQGSDDSNNGYLGNNGILCSPPSPPPSLGGLSSNEGTPLRSTPQNRNKNNSTTRSQVTNNDESGSPELKPSKNHDKFERYRANSELGNELAIEQSQGSTQDSVGTLTDDGQSDEENDQKFEIRKPARKGNSKKIENWDLIKEIQKQLDSGIDDRGSPDARSSSLKRSSLPETVLLREYRHSIEPVVFNSRESGLADSPDSGSLLSTDSHPLNGPHSPPDAPSLATHVLRSPTEVFCPTKSTQKSTPSQENTVSVDIDFNSSGPAVSSQPDFDEFAPTQKSHLLDIESQDSVDSDHEFLIDVINAPRSLDSPMFSSIARNPLRHSKPVDYDFSERRQMHRAATVEPVSLSPEHRAPSLRTRSHTVVSPVHSTNSATSSDSDLTLARSGLSRSMGALATPSPTDSPSNSLKKKKWGKRFTNSIRPALRVLRITPNSSPRLDDPAVREIHLSSHTPENSPSPKDLERGRMRMMSPETVISAINKESSPQMRRSASFDNVLDTSKQQVKPPMAIEPLEVPEAKKQKSKSKLFSSFQGARFRGKSKEQDSSQAVVLVGARKKKVSVDSALAENYSKSPKTKKKSRLPHFV